MARLVDSFGRVHDDLRISVTDRCDLRCAYCIPEEPTWFPRAEILSFEEILRVVSIVLGSGVRTFRITGGEPLVRRDLVELVRGIGAVPGVADLSLTTNGTQLASVAAPLREAGLRRINVSLDTLDRARFERVTKRDALPRVLAGLDAAAAAGLAPIKLNAVLLRGFNEDEVLPLVGMARERGFEIRFIEFMPLGNGSTWDLARVVSGEEVRRVVGRAWPIEPEPGGDPHAPATRYRFADGRGAIGFIDSVTRPFCATCSRLRLTSDGHLRVCLHDPLERDLKALLRGGASDGAILAAIEETVLRKGRGGALDILEQTAPPRLARTMHQIGG